MSKEDAGNSVGDKIKAGWNVVHGAGEVTRGEINSFVDNVGETIAGRKDSNVKAPTRSQGGERPETVVEKGKNEMELGKDQVKDRVSRADAAPVLDANTTKTGKTVTGITAEDSTIGTGGPPQEAVPGGERHVGNTVGATFANGVPMQPAPAAVAPPAVPIGNTPSGHLGAGGSAPAVPGSAQAPMATGSAGAPPMAAGMGNAGAQPSTHAPLGPGMAHRPVGAV